MQKGNQAKINLLLCGIQSRLTQNQEYFISVLFTFKSGSKTFSGDLQLRDGAYYLNYNGASKESSPQAACAFFSEEAEKYQSAELIYKERGSTLTILVSPRGVQMKQSEEDAQTKEVSPLAKGREYIIRTDSAAPLLREIGILTKEGKLKNDMVRKYNQIDHFVELVGPMFASSKDEEIYLLDCACGKSYLSFVINYYLRDVCKRRCHIVGIDINPHVVEESAKMARRLGYHNMEFLAADLRTYEPPRHVTGVISLHACDTATDLALAAAIRAKAEYIACVPCCHKELLEQFQLPQLEPLLKHGIFKARMNDLLTDSLRALKLEAEGYQVSVIEYISPLDTPKNLLIRAKRMPQENSPAKTDYKHITDLLGTNSELDRQTKDDSFFITDDDLA